ncbi:hypothetical protein SNEBB_006881 [Seison nebaliae]|nr:hypothetical protein SNEBB_006881 [Seison nebaliae]
MKILNLDFVEIIQNELYETILRITNHSHEHLAIYKVFYENPNLLVQQPIGVLNTQETKFIKFLFYGKWSSHINLQVFITFNNRKISQVCRGRIVVTQSNYPNVNINRNSRGLTKRELSLVRITEDCKEEKKSVCHNYDNKMIFAEAYRVPIDCCKIDEEDDKSESTYSCYCQYSTMYERKHKEKDRRHLKCRNERTSRLLSKQYPCKKIKNEEKPMSYPQIIIDFILYHCVNIFWICVSPFYRIYHN